MDLIVIRSADGRWSVLSVLRGGGHCYRIMLDGSPYQEVVSLADVRRILIDEVGLMLESLHCAPSARLDG